MKKLIWILTFISLAAVGAIKIDVDLLRSPDHTKVWTPPSATTTLVGTDTSDNLSNKTVDKLVSTSEQVNNTATGSNAVVTTPTSLVTQLTNVSLVSIDGITAPANNQIVILKNKTGANITVNNETGVNTTYRIKTGTAANLTLATDASVILAYSTTDSRWQVVGGSGGSGSGGISNWVTAHAYLTNDVIIQSGKIYQAQSDHTSGTFATDLAGGKWAEISAPQNLTGPITSSSGVTSIASQTGTGTTFVVDTSPTIVTPTISGHPTIEGVTATGATGTGKIVYDTSPTLVTPVLGVATATSINGTTIPTNKTLQDKDALTTKGDLYVATASATTTRQAVGSNKQVLMADSAQSNGIKWADSQVLSKSERDGADVDTVKFTVPNSQLTTTASGSRRIETGNRNVLADPSAESSSTPWGVYADAAGTSPVDGTGGSANVTVANSTSSPLAGASSLLFTKDAANRQGQGMSLAFTIDAADKSKVLRVDFDYQIASGTYADDDMSCWVYDVTNSAMIQPAPYKIKNTTVIDTFSMEFQATTSTSYRLICHVASTSASAYTVKFDNLSVGRGPKVYSNGDTTYSAQISSTGVVSGENVDWINGNCSVASTAVYTCTLKVGIFTTAPNCTVSVANNGSNAYSAKTGTTTSSTEVVFTTINSSSGNVTALPSVLNCQKSSTDYTNATSGRVSSSEADTRVVAASYYANTNFSSSTSTPCDFNTKIYDTHNAVTTGSGWKFTAPVPGQYRISAYIDGSPAAASADSLIVYKNGSSLQLMGYSDAVGNGGVNGAITIYLLAGDYIDLRNSLSATYGGAALTARHSNIQIERISGPSQIQASERVTASYYMSANSSVSTSLPFNMDTKIDDSHGSVTTGSAWKFTAPKAAKYCFSGFFPITVNSGNYPTIYKNGSAHKRIQYNAGSGETGAAGGAIRLLAGEYFDVRSSGSFTAMGNSLGANSVSFIDIFECGNY